MITEAENVRMTRVGPGTPMGGLFRRYWIPVGLVSDLPNRDGPPVRFRLLGEDLVAFRDTTGKVGLVDAYCAHRQAPLFFGRNEDCGLRCVYHGWKFNTDGECVDMPSEAPESSYKTRVKLTSYPVHEAGGLLWTYMGPADRQPPLPELELMRVPETHGRVSKTLEECNWLQAVEGGLDPVHATILHQERIGDLSFLRRYHEIASVTALEVEETDYGLFFAALRDVGEKRWIRAYHHVMPSMNIRGSVDQKYWGYEKTTPTIDGHIWIPIDDTTTWVYNFMYSFDADQPLTEEQFYADETWAGRGPEDLEPSMRSKRNLDNDYLVDRERQRTETFTGITGLNTQDFMVQEGMGPIKDRSREHLGSSDRAIILYRKVLRDTLDGLERDIDPPGLDPTGHRNLRPVDREVLATSPWREQIVDDLMAKF